MNTRTKKVAAGAMIVSLLVVGVVLLTIARGAAGMMRTSAASSGPATEGAACSMNPSQCSAAMASGTCPAVGGQAASSGRTCRMNAGTAAPACHAVQSGSVG
jgi:hypothetical protein